MTEIQAVPRAPMRLYLETSVPNFLFVDDAPEKRQVTQRFFDQVEAGLHQCVVSALYLQEIRATGSALRRHQLEGIVEIYGLEVLRVTEEAERLAATYIQDQAFSPHWYSDALHVAIAVLADCEVVVSWNFRHIVRPWTIQRVTTTNRRLSLPDVVICTPEEVLGNVDGNLE